MKDVDPNGILCWAESGGMTPTIWNEVNNMSIFIIAEIGINHNGSVNIAKQLIDIAKERLINSSI